MAKKAYAKQIEDMAGSPPPAKEDMTVTVDFSENEGLFREVVRAAKADYRPLSHQIMFWIDKVIGGDYGKKEEQQ